MYNVVVAIENCKYILLFKYFFFMKLFYYLFKCILLKLLYAHCAFLNLTKKNYSAINYIKCIQLVVVCGPRDNRYMWPHGLQGTQSFTCLLCMRNRSEIGRTSDWKDRNSQLFLASFLSHAQTIACCVIFLEGNPSTGKHGKH